MDGQPIFTILDPTGNITALVESDVPPGRRAECAAEIMRLHTEVEQTGFVRFFPPSSPSPVEPRVQAELRMAGGEFCGNASISAAALYQLRCGAREAQEDGEVSVLLRVSGADEPVEVRLIRESPRSFRAGIRMPPPRGISFREFSFGSRKGSLPVISMGGITHIVIEEESAFSSLAEKRGEAEKAVRRWCSALSADGLGLMFLENLKNPDGLLFPQAFPGPSLPLCPDGQASYRLTPLVYIPRGDTLFWEHSCASGSAAAGFFLAVRRGRPMRLFFQEPGGVLQAAGDPDTGELWLCGNVSVR